MIKAFQDNYGFSFGTSTHHYNALSHSHGIEEIKRNYQGGRTMEVNRINRNKNGRVSTSILDTFLLMSSQTPVKIR